MIHNLCNIFDEINFDTFFKATVIEATQLHQFNHLSDPYEVLATVNSLPESAQAMTIPFMPQKFSISNNTRIRSGLKLYDTRISFPLAPQDKNTHDLLETYNNKLVLAFITRFSNSVLYGTTAQPLVFSYDEIHSSDPTGFKGYTLSMSGQTYGAPMYFSGSEHEFPIIKRGLAFQLAGKI